MQIKIHSSSKATQLFTAVHRCPNHHKLFLQPLYRSGRRLIHGSISIQHAVSFTHNVHCVEDTWKAYLTCVQCTGFAKITQEWNNLGYNISTPFRTIQVYNVSEYFHIFWEVITTICTVLQYTAMPIWTISPRYTDHIVYPHVFFFLINLSTESIKYCTIFPHLFLLLTICIVSKVLHYIFTHFLTIPTKSLLNPGDTCEPLHAHTHEHTHTLILFQSIHTHTCFRVNTHTHPHT